MLILHGGLTLLHLHGYVWLSETTRVTWTEWEAARREGRKLLWQSCGWTRLH